MRGPIDYIVVGFEGNKFNGEVLEALKSAMEDGVIDLLDLALVTRDKEGNVSSVEIESEALAKASKPGLVSAEDVAEVGEILEDNTSAGLLIIEQLWAKDLKKALIKANGTLLAEGRIHPEASQELN